MGYNTDFTGAIRITPRIAAPLAEKLEQWLVLRHMRRDVAALEQLYATEGERNTHTLFGDGNFGCQGEFYLPDQTKEFSTGYFEEEPYPEGLTNNMSMNFAKFSQNEDLKKMLLDTGDAWLVECAHSDTVWACGIRLNEDERFDSGKWRGQNILGFALMEVRSILRKADN